MINALEGNTDLIILPEMFTTGFTMKPRHIAEPIDGETVQWMKDIASANECAVTGSVVITEDNKYYNRLLFVFPDGTIKQYDKRHLFSLAGEEKEYTAGSKRLIVEYKGWKICPLVCYDVRFPVFSRNTEEYDLLLYVANWPQVRITAWDALLKARAIENMCYTVGVNRTGYDANDYYHPGHSQVLDALGTVIEKLEAEQVAITITLSKTELEATRKKFGFLNDRDNFILQD